MRNVTISDFLTDQQIEQAIALHRESWNVRLHDLLVRDNPAQYGHYKSKAGPGKRSSAAYAVEYVINRGDKQ